MKDNLATNRNRNLNSHSNNSVTHDNKFANESINTPCDTPMNKKESNVKNNQTQYLDYKTLQGKLKAIF